MRSTIRRSSRFAVPRREISRIPSVSPDALLALAAEAAGSGAAGY